MCENCGEYYLSEKIAKQVMQRAEESVKSGGEVEILRFAESEAEYEENHSGPRISFHSIRATFAGTFIISRFDPFGLVNTTSSCHASDQNLTGFPLSTNNTFENGLCAGMTAV